MPGAGTHGARFTSMAAPRDGELTSGGNCRWCESCGIKHGPLYQCPHYPRCVRMEIDGESARWHEELRRELAGGDRTLAAALLAGLTGVHATRREEADRGSWFA